MKKTLALLVASTALTAAIGVPAWSMMRAPSDPSPRAAVLDEGPQAMPLVFARGDADDDRRRREGTRRGHDDARQAGAPHFLAARQPAGGATLTQRGSGCDDHERMERPFVPNAVKGGTEPKRTVCKSAGVFTGDGS